MFLTCIKKEKQQFSTAMSIVHFMRLYRVTKFDRPLRIAHAALQMLAFSGSQQFWSVVIIPVAVGIYSTDAKGKKKAAMTTCKI